MTNNEYINAYKKTQQSSNTETSSHEIVRTLMKELVNSMQKIVLDIQDDRSKKVDKFTIDKAQESDYPDLESSLKGISGLQKLVSAFMDSLSIEKFVPKGEQFDFRFHEALTTVEDKSVEPDTIVDVIQSGYKLEGELLRPAKVVVSKNIEEKGE